MYFVVNLWSNVNVIHRSSLIWFSGFLRRLSCKVARHNFGLQARWQYDTARSDCLSIFFWSLSSKRNPKIIDNPPFPRRQRQRALCSLFTSFSGKVITRTRDQNQMCRYEHAMWTFSEVQSCCITQLFIGRKHCIKTNACKFHAKSSKSTTANCNWHDMEEQKLSAPSVSQIMQTWERRSGLFSAFQDKYVYRLGIWNVVQEIE